MVVLWKEETNENTSTAQAINNTQVREILNLSTRGQFSLLIEEYTANEFC